MKHRKNIWNNSLHKNYILQISTLFIKEGLPLTYYTHHKNTLSADNRRIRQFGFKFQRSFKQHQWKGYRGWNGIRREGANEYNRLAFKTMNPLNREFENTALKIYKPLLEFQEKSRWMWSILIISNLIIRFALFLARF